MYLHVAAPFFSTIYTSLGANLPPESFSEIVPLYLELEGVNIALTL